MKIFSIIIGVVIAVLFCVSGIRAPTFRKVLSQECDPAQTQYDAFGPYCAGVVQYSYLFSKRCEIAIYKHQEQLPDAYGYWIDVPVPRCNFKSIDFQWRDRGVIAHINLLTDDPQIVVEVPKSLFTGGR